jgi:hypothetical protein
LRAEISAKRRLDLLRVKSMSVTRVPLAPALVTTESSPDEFGSAHE